MSEGKDFMICGMRAGYFVFVSLFVVFSVSLLAMGGWPHHMMPKPKVTPNMGACRAAAEACYADGGIVDGSRSDPIHCTTVKKTPL